MRHKYATTAIVLARRSVGEASAFISLLTPEFGLVRARAQSIRKPGAKLASALQTFAESDVILVRGKEGWRLSGAVLGKAWFPELTRPARVRAGRVASLIMRMVHADSSDPIFFSIFMQFLHALMILPTEAEQDAAECLAALRILHTVGVDDGDIPDGVSGTFETASLEPIMSDRARYIVRINRSITASGL